ncbi:stability determinant [Cupriavidus gilardii]|uniref:antitoxin PaaA2 family protein n=1 Tax=Cupriavidus gilardii TaxID=82541 RepID=UPI001ABE59E9|nr:stability determinant [Cupriavidus gilardii]MBO4122163.1 stability determinant [Cupriavidus gilardii]
MSDASLPSQPEFRSAEQEADYDRWFRAEVEAAVRAADSPDAAFIPHQEAMARIRARLLKMGATGSDKPQ